MKRFSMMFIFLTALSFAQDADTILAKNLEAVGGSKAIEGLNSYTVNINAVAMNGMEIHMDIFSKGRKIFIKQSVPAAGMEGVMGCDGVDCYSQDSMMGLRKLEGQEKDSMLLQNDITNIVNWKENYPKREYKGEAELDGKTVYKVYLEASSGMSMTNYYDKSNYMLVRTEFKTAGPMGDMLGDMYYTKYDEIHNGFKVPAETKMSMMGMDLTLKFENYQVNVEIPDSKFALPEGLK